MILLETETGQIFTIYQGIMKIMKNSAPGNFQDLRLNGGNSSANRKANAKSDYSELPEITYQEA